MCKYIANKGSQVDTVEQENSFDENCQGKSEDVPRILDLLNWGLFLTA